MAGVSVLLSQATSAIAAVGALGTAAFGLVDASKAIYGGASKFGFAHVLKALRPFETALRSANADWLATIRANWINGVDKDEQKTAAKSLIRLGLSSANSAALAAAGHVDPEALKAVMTAVETGAPLSTQDAQLMGRFNGAIDAAMDAGFERGDQQYRNSCRMLAGAVAIALSVWGGALINLSQGPAGARFDLWRYLGSQEFGLALLVGVIAVPIAPIAKDLASSLQAAVGALQSKL